MYRVSDDLRFVKNRAALQRAFKDLVVEKQSGRITVKELAERAHVNRMTFYSHYDAIDDVLAEIVDGMVNEILSGQRERATFDSEALLHDSDAVMQRDIAFFRSAAKDEGMGAFRTILRSGYRTIFAEGLAKRPALLGGTQLELAAATVASGVAYAFFDWLAGDLPGVSKSELETYLARYIDVLAHMPRA